MATGDSSCLNPAVRAIFRDLEAVSLVSLRNPISFARFSFDCIDILFTAHLFSSTGFPANRVTVWVCQVLAAAVQERDRRVHHSLTLSSVSLFVLKHPEIYIKLPPISMKFAKIFIELLSLATNKPNMAGSVAVSAPLLLHRL